MSEAAVARLMRWAVAALALLLAGCAAPSNPAPEHPLLGLCPQWLQGPGSETVQASLSGDAGVNRTLAAVNATYEGKALDVYRLRVDQLSVSGRLEVRAFAADGVQQLALRDYRQPAAGLVPVLVFTNGTAAGHEFDAFLSPVTQDAAPAPAPATLRFAGSGGNSSIALTVTYHYKVCGA